MQLLDTPACAPVVPSRVARVVFASRSCVDGPIYGELERIRRSALRNNRALGVHTALLHQSGWFLQWKEGPAVAMRSLMERVARDPRHRDLQVVHASRGVRLLDGPWSMVIVPSDEPPDAMARRIEAASAAAGADMQEEPPEVWRRLSMPVRCFGRQAAQEPELFQRVLFASSIGTNAFETVRWLAARYRASLAQRRFAGLALDVAVESADFAPRGRPTRMVAIARKGLGLPLTRALLPGYSHLVLRLCGQRGPDGALLDRVAAACAAHAQPPDLVGVGADPQEHAVLGGMARSRRLTYAHTLADPRDYAGTWASLQPVLQAWWSGRQSARAQGRSGAEPLPQ